MENEEKEEETLLQIVYAREHPLKKLEKSVSRIAWRDPTGAEDVTEIVGPTNAELARFELQAVRTKNACRAAAGEIDGCGRLREELEEQARMMAEEIKELQAQLESERAAKSNRERYSALAKVISGITSRKNSQAEIEAVNKKIAELEAESDRLGSKKELLGKQFLLLTQTVEDVSDLLLAGRKAPGAAETEEGEAEEMLEDGEQGAVQVGDGMEVEEGEEGEELEPDARPEKRQ